MSAAICAPEILTPEEVAKLLKVPLSWVYEKNRARQRAPLPVHKIGHYLRFEKSEVLDWFATTGTK